MRETVISAPDPEVASADMRSSSLLFRWPALMDEVMGPATGQATVVAGLARPFGASRPRGRVDVLDLGSGTGRMLGALVQELPAVRCTGVEWQPQLVEYAGQEYPEPVYHVADLRSVRLGQVFDLILCVGNTLAYLNPRRGDLTRACATFAAHARPGTLLVLDVMAKGAAVPEQTRQFDLGSGLFGGPIQMSSSSQLLGPHRQFVTRSWTFAHGTVVRDRYKLWAHDPLSLATRLARVGFRRLPDVEDLLAFEFTRQETRLATNALGPI